MKQTKYSKGNEISVLLDEIDIIHRSTRHMEILSNLKPVQGIKAEKIDESLELLAEAQAYRIHRLHELVVKQ